MIDLTDDLLLSSSKILHVYVRSTDRLSLDSFYSLFNIVIKCAESAVFFYTVLDLFLHHELYSEEGIDCL